MLSLCIAGVRSLLVARNRLSLLTVTNGRQESDQQAGSPAPRAATRPGIRSLG